MADGGFFSRGTTVIPELATCREDARLRVEADTDWWILRAPGSRPRCRERTYPGPPPRLCRGRYS